jgi:5-methylcytosine-specific restriction endonuclease McrA
MKKQNRIAFVKHVLRSASLRWQPRNQALVNARVERGLYKCAICGENFKRKDVQIDHILPVIDIKEGFTTFDAYIERLLPEDPNAFQICCVTCHETKTMIEDEFRKKYREEKRKEKKRKKNEQ